MFERDATDRAPAAVPEVAASATGAGLPDLTGAVGNVAFRALATAERGAGVQADGTTRPEVQRLIDERRGRGAALDRSVREQFAEPLGDDLADVRVHTDSESATLARSVSARAFATGRDVFFGQGEYRPGTDRGDDLLGHELAHVVQQRGAPTSGPLRVSQPGDPQERQAEDFTASLARCVSERTLARDTKPKGPGWAKKAGVKVGIDPFGENPSMEIAPGEDLGSALKRKLGALKGGGMGDKDLINQEWLWPIPALPGLNVRVAAKAGLGVEAGIDGKFGLKREDAAIPSVAQDSLSVTGSGFVKGFAEGSLKAGVAAGAPGLNLSVNLGAAASLEAKSEAGLTGTLTRRGDPDAGTWGGWEGAAAFTASLSVQLKLAATGSIDWQVASDNGTLVEIKLYEWTAIDGTVPIKAEVKGDGTVNDQSPEPKFTVMAPPPPAWSSRTADTIEHAQVRIRDAIRRAQEEVAPGPRVEYAEDLPEGPAGARPTLDPRGGAGGADADASATGQGGTQEGVAGAPDDGGGGASGGSAGSSAEVTFPISSGG